jgi:putative component of toxin-antitoxin plasmid stabilization module
MKTPWQFAGLKTGRGNVLKDYVSKDKKFQARVDSFLRRQRLKEVPWGLPDYRPVGDNVGELRIDYLKVEHRLYGYFGPEPRQFTVMLAGNEKNGQQKDIKAVKKIMTQIKQMKGKPEVENYNV